jgi:monomeric sarcosine oxidase
MVAYDVIVLGLGSMGAAAAHELARRGRRVLGLEAFWPAHDQGSGHGSSRIIRQSYFEGADYVPLLRTAYQGWHRLEEQAGEKLIKLCGGVYIGNDTGPTFTGARAAAEQWGLEHEVLNADQLRERFPTLAPADDAMAVWEADAGYVRPESAIAANLGLAAELGAELHFAEPVTGWATTSSGQGVQVQTGQRSYTADRLVIAAGAWAPGLLADLEPPLLVQRQVMYWFAPRLTPELPRAAYSDERHPIFIEERHDHDQIYGFPIQEGEIAGIKVGIHRSAVIRSTSADDLDRTVNADEISHAQHRLGKLVPAIGEVLSAKVCMYTMTPDTHFVIGTHPGHDQVAIACGFSGHGFKFVPVIGEILADLAETGRTDLPIGMFDPGRF